MHDNCLAPHLSTPAPLPPTVPRVGLVAGGVRLKSAVSEGEITSFPRGPESHTPGPPGKGRYTTGAVRKVPGRQGVTLLSSMPNFRTSREMVERDRQTEQGLGHDAGQEAPRLQKRPLLSFGCLGQSIT